jgi:hypothetical protein
MIEVNTDNYHKTLRRDPSKGRVPHIDLDLHNDDSGSKMTSTSQPTPKDSK